MGDRQHSIVKHKTNYFFLIQEDDYLLMYETLAEQLEKEENASSHCKAMIASTLETWMNSKRKGASSEDDLYSYFTYEQWVKQLRGLYKRNTIIKCLNEMAEEGSYTDPESGEIYKGTIKKKPYIQNMFAYSLNLPVVHALLDALPEQSPYGLQNRPMLGRPKKSRLKINDINKNDLNLNGLKKDDINEKPFKKGRNNAKSRLKKDDSYYITHNLDTHNLDNTEEDNDSAATISTSQQASDDALTSVSSSVDNASCSHDNEEEPPAPDKEAPVEDVPGEETPPGDKPKRAKSEKQKAREKRAVEIFALFDTLLAEQLEQPEYKLPRNKKHKESINGLLDQCATDEGIRNTWYSIGLSSEKEDFWKGKQTVSCVNSQYPQRCKHKRVMTNSNSIYEQHREMDKTIDRAVQIAKGELPLEEIPMQILQTMPREWARVYNKKWREFVQAERAQKERAYA